jgi:hypothetical protein
MTHPTETALDTFNDWDATVQNESDSGNTLLQWVSEALYAQLERFLTNVLPTNADLDDSPLVVQFR